jgi:hypothetical protein
MGGCPKRSQSRAYRTRGVFLPICEMLKAEMEGQFELGEPEALYSSHCRAKKGDIAAVKTPTSGTIILKYYRDILDQP